MMSPVIVMSRCAVIVSLVSEARAGARVVPDVVTLAKALGSGVPVGACLTTEAVAAAIKENDLGTTFGGGMLAMAAVAATLEAIEADGMLENVRGAADALKDFQNPSGIFRRRQPAGRKQLKVFGRCCG